MLATYSSGYPLTWSSQNHGLNCVSYQGLTSHKGRLIPAQPYFQPFTKVRIAHTIMIYFRTSWCHMKVETISYPYIKTFPPRIVYFINRQPFQMSKVYSFFFLRHPVYLIYRPPSRCHNLALFFNEFPKLLECASLLGTKLVTCSDFNIHVDNSLNRMPEHSPTF